MIKDLAHQYHQVLTLLSILPKVLGTLLSRLKRIGLKEIWGQHGGSFLLIGGVILVTIAPLLEQNYPINHSTQFNLSWAFQYQRQFFGGQLYPRWLEYSNFGFGNATFVFYPPLSVVATLPFAALGGSVSSSLVGSMTIALLIFALGFYGYATCFFRKSLSLILTIVSLFNPYLLLNLYQRGAMAEVWGIAWIPWILWFSHCLVWSGYSEDSGLKRSFYRVGLILSYSGLMLSHLPTLLLFTIVWVGLPWCVPIQALDTQALDTQALGTQGLNRQKRSKSQGILESYGSFCVAIGLSSFYLLPAWLDQSLVQLENLHPDGDYYPQNRLLITGLMGFAPKVSTHWFDQTIVPYLLLVVILFFLGFLAWILALKSNSNSQTDKQSQDLLQHLWAQYDRREALRQGAALGWCITLLLAIVMVTDVGRIFYGLPLMQKIQFSWRWLSITIVPLSLLLGYIYTIFFAVAKDILNSWLNPVFPPSFFRLKPIHILTQLLVLGLVSGLGFVLFIQGNEVMDQTVFNASEIETFNTLSAQKIFPQEPHLFPQEPFLNWHIRFADGLGLGDVYEYRARQVKIGLPPSSPLPLVQWVNPGSGSIALEDWQYGKRSFQVTNTTNQEQPLTLRQLYYPGWQFHLTEKPWRSVLASKEGLAEIPIPPGTHQAIVAYRGTAAEAWGKILTSFTVGIGVIALIFSWKTQKTESQTELKRNSN